MSYLLDTNICVYFLNGQFELDQKIGRVGEYNCFVSEITVLELLYGVVHSDSSRREQNRKRMEDFIDAFGVRVLPIRPAFEAFAIQKSKLPKAGTPISDFDLLIGCTALINGLTLATRNVKEMNRIEGLIIENWTNPLQLR